MSGRHVSVSTINRFFLMRNAINQRRMIPVSRGLATTNARRQDADSNGAKKQEDPSTQDEPKEESAMARRLSEMTEDALVEGGRSAQKNIQEAGFSEDLKEKLLERVAASTFKSDHAAAHSIVDMPVCVPSGYIGACNGQNANAMLQESAGQGTRDVAGAAPWTGTEEVSDITLRMLDDAKPKPIRMPYKIPQPAPVDLRIKPKRKVSRGVRIAEAKDATATYNLSQGPGLSDKERENLRQEMRERFTPSARPMPVSVQGFASLANERIEDAIARGQFSKIKRGKGVNTQRDHNANNAFMDTTEYFMNKMIQRQEIVPPWIEKQQELSKEVDRFRQRLRADWRRHASRIIASDGGSLDAQMRRAQAYAAAEARFAEREKIQRAFQDNTEQLSAGEEPPNESAAEAQSNGTSKDLPHLPPLRDPHYLSIERPYHEVTVKNLNALARSYNLQAPPVARKPYLNLDRELAACFGDVAPTLAEEIRRRATEKVQSPSKAMNQKATNMVGSLSTTQASRVYDEDGSKGYGFKEFWRDLFSKEAK